MLNPLSQEIAELEQMIVELATFQHLGQAAAAWKSRLDLVLPEAHVTTNQWADEKRYIKGRNELPVKWKAELTPYIPGIQDACDMLGVGVVAVQGNARSGKTVAAENHAMKRWTHGPWGDVFWYMQSESDVEDYMEERGEWMLEHHEEVNEKIDQTYRRNARDRKRVGQSLALWLAATKKTTRGKGAPFIVADEIDAYMPKIRAGILTLLRNRQREFGSAAMLFLASHPDAGPSQGIASVIAQGLRHLWWWLCPHPKCRKPSSPALEASVRMDWNVAHILRRMDGAETSEILDTVRHEARLICPHCRQPITDEMRLEMSSASGAWVQPGQQLVGPHKVKGDHRVDDIMGFIIQCWMTPFINIGKVAREWVAAKIEADHTGDDTALREATVKTKGEVYEGADEAVKIDDWITVRNRMKSGGAYLAKMVPNGVDFLTAFVDIQVNRFEVRVVGWSAWGLESWLIDAFEISGWPADPDAGRAAFTGVRPFTNQLDWDILEHGIIRQSYPLSRAPHLHLPIAKVAIDLGGGEETTPLARAFAHRMIYRKHDPIDEWRIMPHRGSARKDVELYGTARQVFRDDRGGNMVEPIWERRNVNVWKIKRMIARRMKIAVPGPGMMHAPQNMPDRYFRELTSERLIAGEWIPSGRNETWDGWVACETARAALQPQRYTPERWESRPPVWARPFQPGVEAGIDRAPRSLVSLYSRLVDLNTDQREDGR